MAVIYVDKDMEAQLRFYLCKSPSTGCVCMCVCACVCVGGQLRELMAKNVPY